MAKLTSPDIIINEAKSSDLEQLTILFEKYRKFYNQSAPAHNCKKFLEEIINTQGCKIYMAFIREQTNDSHFLRAVGFINCFPYFSSSQVKKNWILKDLFVEPEYRKIGIGNKLIQKAKKLAIDSNSTGVMISTKKEYQEAKKLYLSEGFDENDKIVSFYWKAPQ